MQIGIKNGFRFGEACSLLPQYNPRTVSPLEVSTAENEVILLQQQASGSCDKCQVLFYLSYFSGRQVCMQIGIGSVTGEMQCQHKASDGLHLAPRTVCACVRAFSIHVCT